ncbi:probable G-protein coupled receptor 25 [Cynocephalus volans]|uniref:probable G-protein coupled receptor 25 n=1 Tax=Cynocephalus volans TaxID=110931 RepID=UPI002FC99BEA
MRPTEPWSPSPGTASWDYSGSGALEELQPCPSPDLPYGYAYIPALYLAAFAVGLLGNAFVLWLLAGRRGPRRLVDTFVLHLAAADLGLVLTLPLWAAAAARGGRWPFGDGLCKLGSFLLAGTRCAGALLLAGASVDRYLAVVKLRAARPLRTPRCALAACCGVWAAALLAGLPSLVYRGLQPVPGGRGSQCGEEPGDALQGLGLLLLLLTFVLPLGVTLFCYCRISRRLRRPPRVGRARSRSLRIVFAIEGAFVGCWLPYSALRAVFHLARLRALPLSCALLRALRWGLAVATCLAFVNSCANPVIYLLLDRSFRARARHWVCARAGRQERRISSATSLRRDHSAVLRGRAQAAGASSAEGPTRQSRQQPGDPQARRVKRREARSRPCPSGAAPARRSRPDPRRPLSTLVPSTAFAFPETPSPSRTLWPCHSPKNPATRGTRQPCGFSHLRTSVSCVISHRGLRLSRISQATEPAPVRAARPVGPDWSPGGDRPAPVSIWGPCSLLREAKGSPRKLLRPCPPDSGFRSLTRRSDSSWLRQGPQNLPCEFTFLNKRFRLPWLDNRVFPSAEGMKCVSGGGLHAGSDTTNAAADDDPKTMRVWCDGRDPES